MNRDKWIITFNNTPVSFSDKPFEIKMSKNERKRRNRESAKRKRQAHKDITLTWIELEDKPKWDAAKMLYDYWSKEKDK